METRAGAEYAYAGDAAFLSKMALLKPVNAAVAVTVRFWQDVARHELLGRAVRVSARQFPELHALACRCADTLGIAEPRVYVTPQMGSLNASTYGTEDEAFIVLHSATVDHLTADELTFVIGHECGHIESEHVVYATAARFLARAAGTVVGWAVAPATVALSSWSRAAEITADRAGLLCC